MQTLNDSAEVNSLIDTNASNYINDPNIEYQWAVKAYQHAEVYFNILCALDSKVLKLTKLDQTIYEHFRTEFPDMDVKNIDVDHLKSNESKEKWRPFCESYKDRVEDYNMATLMRIDSYQDYSEENTTLVPRIQFYAVEIARNKEGHNSKVRELFNKQSDIVKAK